MYVWVCVCVRARARMRAQSLQSCLSWQRIHLQYERPGFVPGVGKIPWRREWLPTPVFWPGVFHGQRSLAGYSPWGRKESDTTVQLPLSLFTPLTNCSSSTMLTISTASFINKHQCMSSLTSPPSLESVSWMVLLKKCQDLRLPQFTLEPITTVQASTPLLLLGKRHPPTADLPPAHPKHLWNYVDSTL